MNINAPRLAAICVYLALFFPISANSAPRDINKEEANRDIIVAYYAEPDHMKRLDFMADNYRQHNPLIADGKSGVTSFFAENEKKYPDAKQRMIRIAADGDYVWVHLNTTRHLGDLGLAVVNIFRLENGKIAEHWDIIQSVPEKSLNNNSMF